jgi:quercetin dioxygenase-like cupin family protein
MPVSKIEQSLADVIRRHREANKLSLRALAAGTGFSPSFISQVENGQASPSIASLEKIGAALGLTLSQLFDATDEKATNVVRASERKSLTSGWSKATIEALGHSGPGTRLEPVMITIDPQGSSGKKPHSNAREEFAIVFDGQVNLNLAEEEYILERGDSVVIPPDVPHRWHNRRTTPASILTVTPRSAF